MNRAALIGVLALGFGAGAAPVETKPPLIVLELEAKGATALQAQAATQSVVRGIRELDVFQVLSSEDVRNLLAIERTKELVGEGGGSLGELSKALGARHAVVGSITRVGDKLQVEVRLLDTESKKVLGQKTLGPVAGMEPIASQLPGLSQELLGPLLLEQRGSLTVQSSEPGSEVLVDGTLAGSTPMKAALALPRGQHRLQVRKDGFVEQSRPVRIDPNQTATESFLLVPSADYAEAWKLRHGRLRVGAYIATVTAAAAFAGAFYLGSDTSNTYVNRFVPRQAALSEKPLPAQYSYANPTDAQNVWQQCGANQTSCKADAQRYQTQLLAEEITTIGLGVVALGATVTASYLWLTGEDPNRYMKLIAAAEVVPGGGGVVLVGRF